MIHEMLNHGKVDVNHKNKTGSAALDIARKCEFLDIASCLEEHGLQSSPDH